MEKKLQKYILYIFIDSARFMTNSLSKLSIIFLEEFIELNVYSDMVMKNMKHVELNISIATVSFFNTQILEMIK